MITYSVRHVAAQIPLFNVPLISKKQCSYHGGCCEPFTALLSFSCSRQSAVVPRSVEMISYRMRAKETALFVYNPGFPLLYLSSGDEMKEKLIAIGGSQKLYYKADDNLTK